MAVLECTYRSDVLGMERSMTVILPQRTMRTFDLCGVDGGDAFPVLYLLHGLSDNYQAWCRYTSIERYVAKLPLIVVMPDVNRSFYCDMNQGYRYFTHVTEEVPRICKGFFPISDAREHTFVAGLSMGGYGAFKMAMRCPDKFCAAASMSGCLDLRGVDHEWESVPGERELVFGAQEAFEGGPNDLVHLAEKLVSGSQPRPKMYSCCGADDFIVDTSRSFKREADRIGLDLEYEEESGDHNWGYWDQKIRKVLDWLPLPVDA